jgi:hypothetical protein
MPTNNEAGVENRPESRPANDEAVVENRPNDSSIEANERRGRR